MKVNINGKKFEEVFNCPFNKLEIASDTPIIILPENVLEGKLDKYLKIVKPITTGVVVSKLATFTGVVLAATNEAVTTVAGLPNGKIDLVDKLYPLIELVQDLALPVGIVVSTWGLLEYMIGNPAGKDKIKGAVVGFIGIFIIPSVFYAIRGAFR